MLSFQLIRRHGGHHHHSSSSAQQALEDLRSAFDAAERSSPGLADLLSAHVVARLQPETAGASDARLRQCLDRLRK